MQYTIFYPTRIEEIEDISNDNIDVCITTDTHKHYTFVIATAENIAKQLLKDCDYMPPVPPVLVVKRLTYQIIERMIAEIMSQDERIIDLYGSDVEYQ